MSSRSVTSLAVATALTCVMIASGAAAILDQASRAYSEGKPVVMILTGSSDRTGPPQRNLDLSQQRANAVLQGLIGRGIPAYRFQILAKGESEPPVATRDHTSEPRNRSVAITWR